MACQLVPSFLSLVFHGTDQGFLVAKGISGYDRKMQKMVGFLKDMCYFGEVQ